MNKLQFRSFLREFHIHFAGKTWDIVFDVFDADGDGFITESKFAQFVIHEKSTADRLKVSQFFIKLKKN